MSAIFHQLLADFDLFPVLVDVGASGKPPEIWEPIAPRSVYIGLDPDGRQTQADGRGRFHKTFFVPEAVTWEANKEELSFYLTRAPYCSSALKPEALALENHLFADLFAVEEETKVAARPLDHVLDSLEIAQLDWLKTDSQGLDLRLFNGLRESRRARILALDIEPGLIDAYQGEDLFADAHKDLVTQGFWLSDLQVNGTVRMRQTTLKRLLAAYPELDYAGLERGLKPSPGWCNARYLRTLEWLEQQQAGPREYALLWIFAVLDRQFGFALDTALAYEALFGPDGHSNVLREEMIQRLKELCTEPGRTGFQPVPSRRPVLPAHIKEKRQDAHGSP